MPFISEHIPISNTSHDWRVKLLPEQRQAVKDEHAAGASKRALALKYWVSLSLIKYLTSPARQEYQKKRNKEHWKDYYNREQLTIACRKLRQKKHKLYNEGVIKLTDKPITIEE